MSATTVYAVVAGGGTAGHLLPALAIARALVARGHEPSSIHFVGSRRGPEATAVPDAGFPVTLLPGRGIQRRLALANAGAVAGLAVAVLRGVALVARRRPAVVVTVGGYASVPCVIGAVLLRVPLVIHEQNAVPGAANRLAGRFARAAAVSFEGTALPRAVLTGNPIRPEIAAVVRTPDAQAQARAALGLPAGRFVVAATGGSLGSRRINTAVRELAEMWADRADIAIRHVIGRRDWVAGRSDLPEPPAGGLVYQAVEYEDRMPLLLAAADVIVSRSGGSVAELAAVGVPAILVPLPIAPGDHQTANARALVDEGGAVLVPDADLDGPRLAAVLEPLIADRGRLASMAQAVRRLAHPDAADRVAEVVEHHARRR